MKKTLIALSMGLLSSVAFAAPINNKSAQQDQLGYSYGYVMGRSNADTLKQINLDAFIQGIKEGSTGQKAALTDEEMAKALAQYKQQTEAKQLLEFKKAADENAQLGEKFLAENAKKAGVITRPSGLQYSILQQGTGKSPSAKSKVSVNYEGRLLDGTVFDSSFARNEAVEFQVAF
jgi:FKBP-type peptidyl-prolyl cis-trans isomerase FklB